MVYGKSNNQLSESVFSRQNQSENWNIHSAHTLSLDAGATMPASSEAVMSFKQNSVWRTPIPTTICGSYNVQIA